MRNRIVKNKLIKNLTKKENHYNWKDCSTIIDFHTQQNKKISIRIKNKCLYHNNNKECNQNKSNLNNITNKLSRIRKAINLALILIKLSTIKRGWCKMTMESLQMANHQHLNSNLRYKMIPKNN